MLESENDFDGQGKGRRIADEGTEGHGVDDGHDPGLLVAEDPVLAAQIVPHEKAYPVEQQDRRGDDPEQHEPLAPGRQAQPEGGGENEIEGDGGGKEPDQKHRRDASEGAQGAAGNHRGHLLGADIAHAEPAGERERDEGEQPHEARVLHPGLGASGDLADKGAGGILQDRRLAAQGAEETEGHDQRHHDLHGRHAGVPEAGVEAEGQALHALGKEEADIGHRGGEIAAAEPGGECEELEYPQGRGLILQGEAGADRWDHQEGGREENRVPTPGDADKEGAGNPQGGTGEAGDGGEREQLGLAEREAEIEHLHRDDAPVKPHREPAQEARNRDHEVAVGDALSGRVPECAVLDIPLGNVGHHSLSGCPKRFGLISRPPG